jgi:hypothetical protein
LFGTAVLLLFCWSDVFLLKGFESWVVDEEKMNGKKYKTAEESLG